LYEKRKKVGEIGDQNLKERRQEVRKDELKGKEEVTSR
jgi:hypothetical protein